MIRSWYVALVFGLSVVLVVFFVERAALERGCAPECFLSLNSP